MSFNKDKPACKLLITLLKNYDYENLNKKVVDILDKDSNNGLAGALYTSKFTYVSYCEGNCTGILFNEIPLIDYFSDNIGKIDLEFSNIIARCIFQSIQNSANLNELLKKIMENVNNLNISSDEKYEFFNNIYLTLYDNSLVENLKKYSAQCNKLAWSNILITRKASLSAVADTYAQSARDLIDILKKKQENLINTYISFIRNNDVDNRLNNKIEEKIKKNKRVNRTIEILWIVGFVVLIIFLLVCFST